MTWYAVQHGDNFDWDNGSYRYESALRKAGKMCKEMTYNGEEIRIAFINDGVCEQEEIIRKGRREWR